MINFSKFFGQVRSEMEKVAWPSKNELIGSTMVVIISSVLLGVFIGICDIIFTKLVNFLIGGVL